MIKQEPRISIQDLAAGFFFFLGLILFITVVHILTIESTGNTATVLNGTFRIFLFVIEFLLLITMAYVIIHLLKWLAWSVNTPTWKKKQIQRQKQEQSIKPGGRLEW